MIKWFKQRSCEHDFEIVKKGFVSIYGFNFEKKDYFLKTTATCIKCKFSETLNLQRVTYVEHGGLVKVYRDPRGIYSYLLKEDRK